MTQEAFIKVLDRKDYSYKIKGDLIVVTYKGSVSFDALTSLPPGVEFKNGEDVYLVYLVGGWFGEWQGNIEGIDPKRLLNVMIKQGVFI